MKLISVTPNTNSMRNEKFIAVFEKPDGKKITRRFGVKGSLTYVDGANENQKENYRARHARDIRNDDPAAKGNLSYYITWGDSKNLETNIREYKKRFNV